MPKPPAAEFLHTGLARYGEPANDERNREEGYDRVVSPAVELDVVVDAFRIQVECVGALDDRGDDGEETEQAEDIYRFESVMEERMPACVGMTGPDYALGKEEVDHEE